MLFLIERCLLLFLNKYEKEKIMAKSKVYFTKDLSSHSLVKLFDLLDKKLTGNVAVKIHSGEEGNQNYLRPDYLKEIMMEKEILLKNTST